jgi:hypothetical protein
MSRARGAEIHRSLLQRKTPEAFFTVDLFYIAGQSNAAKASSLPIADGIAWSVTRPPQQDRGLTVPFGWKAFATEWFALTGRRTVWCNLAFAGTALTYASSPTGNYRFSIVEMPKCMVGDYVFQDEIAPRRTIMRYAKDAVTFNPAMRLASTNFIWVQGEQDANVNPLNLRTIYEEELDDMFSFVKAEVGIDNFFIVELGRKGVDAAEVAANEPVYQLVRDAQNAVAAGRSETHMIFTGTKELGTPFNTITVDGNGYWSGGFEYADGVHSTDAADDILCKTAARNAVQLLGL